MPHIISRRDLMTGSLATAAVSLLNPREAVAGPWAAALGYFLGGDIITAVAEVIEDLYTGSSRQSGSANYGDRFSAINNRFSQVNGTLSRVAESVKTLASTQERILDLLATQRIVMRQEIRAAFLANDTADLTAMGQHYKDLLAYGDIESQRGELNNLVGRVGEVAAKISTYGVPAVAAYHAAIALQNAAHLTLGTPPQVIKEINYSHYMNLNYLLSGGGPDSLPAIIRANYNSSLDGLPSDSPLRQFGYKIPLWYHIQGYSNQSYATGTVRGFVYEGIVNNEPVFQAYTDRKNINNDNYNPQSTDYQYAYGYYENFQRYANGSLARIQPHPISYGGTLRTENYREPYIDRDGYPWDNTDLNAKLVQERIMLRQYYVYLHNAGYSGTNITPNSVGGGMTSGQADIQQELGTSIAAVTRIWNAANKKAGFQLGMATAPEIPGRRDAGNQSSVFRL